MRTSELTSGRAVSRTQSPPSIRHPFIRRGPGFIALVFLIVASFMMVNVVDPYSGALAASDRVAFDFAKYAQGQSIIAAEAEMVASSRDGVQAIARLTPAAGVPDPGTAQAIAYVMVVQKGWSGSEFDCLVNLWNRESHWNVNSHNSSSGAHGIPQALPGNKMASAGPDWETNPKTQITWGLGYIERRYGTPCGAWAHSEEHNWY